LQSLFAVGSAASGPSDCAPCILCAAPGIPANSQDFSVATLDWQHVDFLDTTDRSPACVSSIDASAPFGTQPMNNSFARDFVAVEKKISRSVYNDASNPSALLDVTVCIKKADPLISCVNYYRVSIACLLNLAGPKFERGGGLLRRLLCYRVAQYTLAELSLF
jgi:hypothetical protein